MNMEYGIMRKTSTRLLGMVNVRWSSQRYLAVLIFCSPQLEERLVNADYCAALLLVFCKDNGRFVA